MSFSCKLSLTRRWTSVPISLATSVNEDKGLHTFAVRRRPLLSLQPLSKHGGCWRGAEKAAEEEEGR